MSAPLILNSQNLRDLADALDGLTEVRNTTGVDCTPYGKSQVEVADAVCAISWDADAGEHRIDDRIGD